MKAIELYIAQRQRAFERHSFFSRLQVERDFRDVLSFAPRMTFWVMAFQDILRLNASLTRDPDIRKIVRHHRIEDAGHDRWFLEDLAEIEVSPPNVRWLFGKRHSPTRDAAYALVAEVFRATDDRLRLVLVKTLESAGHVFFGQVSTAVERAGRTSSMKYFSFSHLQVEKGHEVFERQMADKISAMELPLPLRTEAQALVDRCYQAFDTMFQALGAGEEDASGAALLEGEATRPGSRRGATRT